MQEVNILIENGFILSNNNNKTKIPDYFYEDETNIYQIKELIKYKINSLDKNATLKITNTTSYKQIICKDDDIFDKENKLTIFTAENNGIPSNMKTGLTNNNEL